MTEEVPKAKRKRPLSRPARWADAAGKALDGLNELVELQQEYQEMFDNMPENLHSSPMGEKLEAITELDLESAQSTVEEAESIDLPMGFGRD